MNSPFGYPTKSLQPNQSVLMQPKMNMEAVNGNPVQNISDNMHDLKLYDNNMALPPGPPGNNLTNKRIDQGITENNSNHNVSVMNGRNYYQMKENSLGHSNTGIPSPGLIPSTQFNAMTSGISHMNAMQPSSQSLQPGMIMSPQVGTSLSPNQQASMLPPPHLSQSQPMATNSASIHSQSSPNYPQPPPINSQPAPMYPQTTSMQPPQTQMHSPQAQMHSPQAPMHPQQPPMHPQQPPMHLQQPPMHPQQPPMHPPQPPMHQQQFPMHPQQPPMHPQQPPMHPQQPPMHTQSPQMHPQSPPMPPYYQPNLNNPPQSTTNSMQWPVAPGAPRNSYQNFTQPQAQNERNLINNNIQNIPPLPPNKLQQSEQSKIIQNHNEYPKQEIQSPPPLLPPGAQYTGPPQFQPGAQPYPQPMQTQQRRLDPDQMPNPIQVAVENQRSMSGQFVTNQPGLVPPLVTTNYITYDQGNSGPRFIRSSLYSVPVTNDMLKQASIPFTLIISPFAKLAEGEVSPPIVDLGESGPVRCGRCKAYISPHMQFMEGGRRFLCVLCKVTTDVPNEYFQHLDHMGQRLDKYERPELLLGTYEIVATNNYCRDNKPPNVPAFIFVIDVSYNNIKSGLVNFLCSKIPEVIKNLPIDQIENKSKIKVGFITYNSNIHFYNINSSLGQPQMMVVSDVHDVFMPLLDGFLGDVEDCAHVIDNLMKEIPNIFSETRDTETVLYPAIQAGLEALKAYNCVGKIIVFNSSLPTAEAPGKLKNRDDRKLLGTDKEKTILSPQTNAYTTLGQECCSAGCSVDLFVFNNSYVDLATIGEVCRLTGGDLYKYTYFQSVNDGMRMLNDLIRNVSRNVAFDTVMRVRTSTGIRPTAFYGNFVMQNTTDVEIGSIDCNKSIAVEIKHDDKLAEDENVYIQVALLYTSCSGQRRLRIMNLVLKSTSQMADVFKNCDLNSSVLFMAKQSVNKLMECTPKVVKDNLIKRSAHLLACYRKHCTSPASAGQLILPEGMKLLPLYILCLIKNDAISGGCDMTCDDRSYVMQLVYAMNLPISVNYFYPRLIPLHDININDIEFPTPIRCTFDKMQENGAYILENGVHMFFWLGIQLSPEFTQQVFGVQNSRQINTEILYLPELDTPLSIKIRNLIDNLQNERTRFMKLTFVRQKDKMEAVFRHFLVEDRGTDGSPSYIDFLCHMHKEIKDLLS